MSLVFVGVRKHETWEEAKWSTRLRYLIMVSGVSIYICG